MVFYLWSITLSLFYCKIVKLIFNDFDMQMKCNIFFSQQTINGILGTVTICDDEVGVGDIRLNIKFPKLERMLTDVYL